MRAQIGSFLIHPFIAMFSRCELSVTRSRIGAGFSRLAVFTPREFRSALRIGGSEWFFRLSSVRNCAQEWANLGDFADGQSARYYRPETVPKPRNHA